VATLLDAQRCPLSALAPLLPSPPGGAHAHAREDCGAHEHEEARAHDAPAAPQGEDEDKALVQVHAPRGRGCL